MDHSQQHPARMSQPDAPCTPTAAAGAPLPTDDLTVELASAQEIQEAFDIPCEHSQHRTLHPADGPAVFLIVVLPTVCRCRAGEEFWLCRQGWESTTTIVCGRCNRSGTREQFWKVVGVRSDVS